MCWYGKSFFQIEITSLPQIMQRYMGKFYNNTLYNGITWTVFILHIIRFLFEFTVNALLKKMGFKEYLRIRLKKSLWYLGFYTCCYLYCSATLWKNDIAVPDEEKFLSLDLAEPISGNLILGYVLLCAFFISSSMWEGLLCSFLSFNYLFLTGFVAFTYIELSVLLANTICAFHIMTEFSRCLSCIIKAHLNIPRRLVYFAFIFSIATFVSSYLAVIPRWFLFPIGRGLIYNSNSVIMICLNATLWGWFLCELYVSPLYRLILHNWRHQCFAVNIVPECLGSTIECALFQPRDDVAYNLNVIRNEIKEQEARLQVLRQPKRSARMLLQTLKCVAALNRRIKYKRQLKSTEDNWNAEEEDKLSNQIVDVNSNEDKMVDDIETGRSAGVAQEVGSICSTSENEIDKLKLNTEQRMPLNNNELQ